MPQMLPQDLLPCRPLPAPIPPPQASRTGEGGSSGPQVQMPVFALLPTWKLRPTEKIRLFEDHRAEELKSAPWPASPVPSQHTEPPSVSPCCVLGLTRVEGHMCCLCWYHHGLPDSEEPWLVLCLRWGRIFQGISSAAAPNPCSTLPRTGTQSPGWRDDPLEVTQQETAGSLCSPHMSESPSLQVWFTKPCPVGSGEP